MSSSQFWTYFQYGLMFFAGQAIHLLLIKIPSLKKKAIQANKKFIFEEWWKEDWNIIIATNVLGVMALIGLDELLHWKPEIQNTVKWFFAGIGAFGSSLAMQKFSNYERALGSIVDIKSNIADKIVGPTTDVQDLIEKGSVQTGSDVTISPVSNSPLK